MKSFTESKLRPKGARQWHCCHSCWFADLLPALLSSAFALPLPPCLSVLTSCSLWQTPLMTSCCTMVLAASTAAQLHLLT